MECYLDNAATTKPSEAAVAAMLKVLTEDYGNPSSKHIMGLHAGNYVKNTSELLAKEWKVEPSEVVLTSGGTESNNTALIGAALANKRAGMHIISSAFEHASVYKPLEFLESQGFEVDYIGVDSMGHINTEELLSKLREDTILVSIMYVNNEVGAIQDIAALSKMIKAKNSKTLFHVDAIQAYGKMKVYPGREGIDLMSVSGHKFHAPKGSGALYIRRGVKIKPYIYGGGQQRDMRSGTENVPAIAGFGAAVEELSGNLDSYRKSMYECKAELIRRALMIDGVVVNAVPKDAVESLKNTSLEDIKAGKIPEGLYTTAPHIVSLSFSGIDRSEVLLHALEEKGVYVSSGSACSSNHPGLSGSLKAIGVGKDLLESTLRFSFCSLSTTDEVDYAADCLETLLPLLRRFKRK